MEVIEETSGGVRESVCVSVCLCVCVRDRVALESQVFGLCGRKPLLEALTSKNCLSEE